jgi:1-acyl-sn-glycerol-3-phosphate acyltransferase
MSTEGRNNRLAILEKIALYEKNGWFDRDVEDDPPTRPLKPGEADYTQKKLSSKLGTFLANRVAHAFFEKKIRRGELVIRAVEGLEHYRAVKGGAMLTCNHFNPFDNYAVFKAIEKELPTRELYKIIREGNYTSFGGLYGYFFRHCNTLPLGENHRVLGELNEGIKTLLGRGEKILIYPEQGMWWNYRKPRPLKDGAFRFAAKNGAPVIPFFITMEDSDREDDNGFPIQAYTVHILPAIHPDPTKSVRENAVAMRDRNYALWKETYERVYGVPLTYGEV